MNSKVESNIVNESEKNPKPEGKRYGVSSKVTTRYETVCEELKTRELKNFSFSLFLDQVFGSLSEEFFKEIVEQNTPDDYRIKLALQDESVKKMILKMASEKNKRRRKEKISEIQT